VKHKSYFSGLKITYMKNLFILFVIVLSVFSVKAQLFEISVDPIFRNSQGDVYTNALAGGLNQPQFSNLDFNGDGKLDLFVFDRTGNKVLVFISESTTTALGVTMKYVYDPSYEEFFPKASEFMQLKDYNGDNKPDLWMYDGDSVVLYQNNTLTTPKFDYLGGLSSLDRVQPVEHRPYKRISHVKGCLPAIVDIDNDDDIDYIANLNVIGSQMILFSNTSSENKVPLEEIGFEILDKCYGGVDENSEDMIINASCLFGEGYKKKKHTATKTLLFFDNDNDGDKDLFYGTSERETNPLYFFENGKTDLNFYKDTFIRMDTSYFPQGIESQIPTAPTMSYVDVNLDGEMDLILSTNEVDKSSFPIHEKNNVLLFLNDNTTSNPDFNFQYNDFLVGDMIDFGAHTAPVLADLDGDGDDDLFLATNGDHFHTGDTSDFLVYFENVGTRTNPDFKLVDEDYLGIKDLEYTGLVPAFADLDGDNDLDLFLGKSDGTIAQYENTGTSNIPVFSLKTENYATIDVQSAAAPYFYDLDENGTIDLLVGTYDGNIHFYENTGTASLPSFSLLTDSLGGIVINELIRTSEIGPEGTLIDVWVPNYYGYSAPAVVTWSDGSKCIAVGGDEGVIRIFDVADDFTAKFTEHESYMNKEFDRGSYTKDWGTRTYPAVSDLNGDGIEDILIGNSRGGLNYVEGQVARLIGSTSRVTRQPFTLAPNPSNGDFTIYANSAAALSYRVTDLTGKTVLEGNTLSGTAVHTLGQLSSGVYFVDVKDRNTTYATQKLIISN
jgi:hypothetical protein